MPAVPAPRHVVWLHAAAPAPPLTGAACNGCGLCCAVEPCPLGMLLSRRRRGRCSALRWHAGEARYRCAAVSAGGGPLRRLARRLALRWIAAGAGCDAALEALPAPR